MLITFYSVLIVCVVLHDEHVLMDRVIISCRVYKTARKLYAEADSQGLRVYHDELIDSDVRLVMCVPNWFPKPGVQFDWSQVKGDRVSVVIAVRGTVQVRQLGHYPTDTVYSKPCTHTYKY